MLLSGAEECLASFLDVLACAFPISAGFCFSRSGAFEFGFGLLIAASFWRAAWASSRSRAFAAAAAARNSRASCFASTGFAGFDAPVAPVEPLVVPRGFSAVGKDTPVSISKPPGCRGSVSRPGCSGGSDAKDNASNVRIN